MSKSHSPKFVEAVEAIYAAALEPSHWPAVLQTIADCFDDVGANLIYKRDDGSAVTIVSPALQAAHEDYDAGWWQQDIRWARVTDYVYRGHTGAVTDRHMVTSDEMVTHPFYTEFQPRHGLRWVASMEVSPDPHITVALSMHRGPAKPAYSDDELASFTRLGEHVEKSLRLGIRMIKAEVANLGLSEALSRLSIGVFLLDGLGRAVFSNLAGQRALGDGLVLVGDRLTTKLRAEKESLEAAIALAIGESVGQVADQLRPIMIQRGSSERPLTAYVLPIRLTMQHIVDRILSPARAILLVIDTEAGEPPDPALVRDLLGLTLSEARIASLVGFGIPPREAATKLGISEETARTALKRVFTKVGVSRQSELAALMTRLVLR